MYENTTMVGLNHQIKPTMMVLFMGMLKWLGEKGMSRGIKDNHLSTCTGGGASPFCVRVQSLHPPAHPLQAQLQSPKWTGSSTHACDLTIWLNWVSKVDSTLKTVAMGANCQQMRPSGGCRTVSHSSTCVARGDERRRWGCHLTLSSNA